MMDTIPTGNERILKAKLNPFFEIFGDVVEKTRGVTNFPYWKMMIVSAPLAIQLAEDEFEKHNIYETSSRLLVSLLEPYFHDREYDDLCDEFNRLKAETRACGNVQIGIEKLSSGNNVTIKYSTFTSTLSKKLQDEHHEDYSDSKVGLRDYSPDLHCSEAMADLGRGTARDNGYNLINCQVSNTFWGLMCVASKLGLIKFDDVLPIDNRQIKPEEFENDMNKFKSIRKA